MKIAKISANASMGVKLKYFSDFENINPQVSIGVEMEVPDASKESLVAEAGELYKMCRKFVQAEIGEDVKTAKAPKEKK